MFKIRNKDIYITRGDDVSLKLVCNNGIFKAGDIITMYTAENRDLLLSSALKTLTIQHDTKSIIFNVEGSVTKRLVREKEKDATILWYGIKHSRGQETNTIIGFGPEGSKTITIYPEAIRNSDKDPIQPPEEENQYMILGQSVLGRTILKK